MRTTQCKCQRAHVRKVKTSPFSVFGEKYVWMAARPGQHYLAGHGFHFMTWQDAINYASGAEA